MREYGTITACTNTRAQVVFAECDYTYTYKRAHMEQAYTVRVKLEVVNMLGNVVNTTGEPATKAADAGLSIERDICHFDKVIDAHNLLHLLNNSVVALKTLVERAPR